MARTKYSFEKRQRELAKKKKKEDKAAKKASGTGDEDAMNPNEAALALSRDDAPDAAAPAQTEGEERA